MVGTQRRFFPALFQEGNKIYSLLCGVWIKKHPYNPKRSLYCESYTATVLDRGSLERF